MFVKITGKAKKQNKYITVYVIVFVLETDQALLEVIFSAGHTQDYIRPVKLLIFWPLPANQLPADLHAETCTHSTILFLLTLTLISRTKCDLF